MAEALLTRTVRWRPAGPMAQIAAGKGRTPKPFMLAGAADAAPDAVWRRAARTPNDEAAAGQAGQGGDSDSHGGQSGRQCRASSRRSCASSWSGRPRRRLGPRNQVRRLSHAAARRRRQGRAAHPQGPRLDRRSSPPSPRRRRAARLHPRRRDRGAGSQRRAGFRGAAGGAVGRQDRRPDLLRLRSAVRGRRGSARRCRCRERKARLEALLDAVSAATPICAMSSISRPAAMRCCNRPAACRWKASSRRRSTRPTGPAAATAGPRPSAAPAMKW